MASNLSISISANTGEAKAQISLVTAELNQTNRALAALAKQAAASGTGVTDAMRGMAAQAEAFRLEQAKLFAEMKETSVGAFGKLQEAVKAPLEGLAMLRSSLRETAEMAGAAFAVDEIRDWISSMAELGEHTVNMAAAVGTTPHEFSLLSNALRLAGGDAETASSTLERLGRNMQEALTVKTSQAAKAVASLGITQSELKRASTDLSYALDLMADKFREFADSPQKSADFMALMGRNFESLVPLLRQGSAGMEEFKRQAQDTGLVLSDQEAEALDETGEKIHLLSATLEGEGVRGFMSIRAAIDTAIDGLTSFIREAGDAVAAVTNLANADTRAEQFRLVREGKARQEAPSPMGPFPGGRHNPRLNPNYAGSNPLAASGYEMNIGGMDIPPADQDFAGSGKPQVAPWPTEGGRSRGGGQGGGAGQDYAAFAENERLKLEEARGNWTQISAIYDEWLAHAAQVYGQDSAQYKRVQLDKGNAARQAQHQIAEEAEQGYAAQRSIDQSYQSAFDANMAAMVAQHKISKQQMYGFEVEYTAQLRDQMKQQLQAIIDNDNLAVADRRRAWEEMVELQASENAKITEYQAKAAEEASNAWTQSVKQMSDQFATLATDVVTRTKSIGQAFDDMIRDMFKDTMTSTFKGIFNSLLGGGGESSGGGGFDLTKLLFGQGGLGSLFSGGGGSTSNGSEGGDQDFSGGASGGGSSIFGSLFSGLLQKGILGGAGSLLSGAGTAVEAGSVADLWGGGGAADVAAGLTAGGSGGIMGGLSSLFGGAAGGIGSLFSGAASGFGSLFSALPLLFLEKGGIVPSAAGGWSVPQLGSGGTLAQLHSNEMVLPANISQGFQNMLSGGGSGGGGGHTFNMNISAMDGASVMSMGPKIVASINKAIRNGSPLFQPS